MKKIFVFIFISLFLFQLGRGSVFARQVVLGSLITVGYDFNDREYDDGTGEEEDEPKEDVLTSELLIKPDISFVSRSESNSFTLRYVPILKHELVKSENSVSHDLFMEVSEKFTEKWSIKLSERFLSSDDPRDRKDEEDDDSEEGGTESSLLMSLDDNDRHGYIRNDVSLVTSYFFGKNSLVSLAYDYDLLRNDDTGVGGYEDYDKHTLWSIAEYRFDPIWKISLRGEFIIGLFEPADYEESDEPLEAAVGGIDMGSAGDVSEDVREYHGTVKVEMDYFRHNPLSLEYRIVGIDYFEGLQDDLIIHEGTIVWKHIFSAGHTFSLGGGPSFRDTEDTNELWEYNATLDYRYPFERGYVQFSLDKGLEQDNFSEVDDRGFVDSWLFSGTVSYHFFEKLSGEFRLSYKEEERSDLNIVYEDERFTNEGEENYHVDKYSASIRFLYSFLIDYGLEIKYSFTSLDSELELEDYQEHRVQVSLKYQTEWMR